MKSVDKELFLHLKHLIEIGLADDDDEILPDAQESVKEDETLKLTEKLTLTKQRSS